jgi:hypothetical protein
MLGSGYGSNFLAWLTWYEVGPGLHVNGLSNIAQPLCSANKIDSAIQWRKRIFVARGGSKKYEQKPG